MTSGYQPEHWLKPDDNISAANAVHMCCERKVGHTGQWSPIASQEGMPLYQGIFSTFDDARQYIVDSDTSQHVAINPNHDDWSQVYMNVHHFARMIFDALSDLPGPPPPNFSEEMQGYYVEHQNARLESNCKIMKKDPVRCEARVMLAVEEVVKVHAIGIPTQVYGIRAERDGYKFEHLGACSSRMNAVISAVQSDKYCATDVLTGKGLDHLARSPGQYLKNKQDHSRVNAKKAIERKNRKRSMQENMEMGGPHAGPQHC